MRSLDPRTINPQVVYDKCLREKQKRRRSDAVFARKLSQFCAALVHAIAET